MSGKTAAEKILGRASGKAFAKAGDVVEAVPDIALSHENAYLVEKAFAELGLAKPWDPARIALVLDHRTPANTARTANVHAHIRALARRFGVGWFFDAGEGICHQLLVEERIARPGQLVLGTDSHTTTAGAVGALGVGIGATEMAGVWALGSLWLKVPSTIRLKLTGHLREGVCAKDVALALVRRLGPTGAEYRCVEFFGPLLAQLPIAGRLVLCNMATEMGAKCAFADPDVVTSEWYRGFGEEPVSMSMVRSDEDATFEKVVELDACSLEPMVSGPHKVEAADAVGKFEGIEIDQAFIGTCTNGRLEDLLAAARVLRGRKVSPRCRLVVAPASRKVLMDAVECGAVKAIVAAGGVVLPPGCGPCLGAHGGVLGPGEVCISTGNRNFRGRMGSEEAEIYLASPSTVAASAVEGRIADPRRYIG